MTEEHANLLITILQQINDNTKEIRDGLRVLINGGTAFPCSCPSNPVSIPQQLENIYSTLYNLRTSLIPPVVEGFKQALKSAIIIPSENSDE